ncbi:MAG: cyclic nucleotide-binding/CBS domain-containing protein [Kiloniellales bacterium]
MPHRKVAEIVPSRRIVRLPPQASVREASRLMVRERVGAVLVIEGPGEGAGEAERLVGIFTERDALNRVIATEREPEHTTLAEVMTPDPVTVSPQATAIEALRLMRDGGYRHLPVAEPEESGRVRVVGVISLRDFIGAELAAVEQEARFTALLADGSGRGGGPSRGQ